MAILIHGISTIVSYLMSNLLYTYIKYMICKHILLITFLEEQDLFCTQLNGLNDFFLSNMKISICSH